MPHICLKKHCISKNKIKAKLLIFLLKNTSDIASDVFCFVKYLICRRNGKDTQKSFSASKWHIFGAVFNCKCLNDIGRCISPPILQPVCKTAKQMANIKYCTADVAEFVNLKISIKTIIHRLRQWIIIF